MDLGDSVDFLSTDGDPHNVQGKTWPMGKLGLFSHLQEPAEASAEPPNSWVTGKQVTIRRDRLPQCPHLLPDLCPLPFSLEERLSSQLI